MRAELNILEKDISDSEYYKQIYEWLKIYHSTSDEKQKENAKSRVVERMIPVVNRIARTIARRSYDPIEDMVQAGCIGLLKAIDKYSYEKNDNFRIFAGYYIIGEMKHYLRDKLNAIRVPRYIQELAIRIHNFTQTLTNEELNLITNEEVAYALDTTPATVDLAMQVERRKCPVYFEDIYSDPDSLGFEELLADNNDRSRPEFADAKIILNDIMLRLPTRERIVVDMYYKRNMNKKEIAQSLNISQTSVTRRMNQAFEMISSLILNEVESDKIKKGNLFSEDS